MNRPMMPDTYTPCHAPVTGGIVVPAGWVKEKAMLLSGGGTFTSDPIPANAHGMKFSLPFETETEIDHPFW